MSDAEDDDSTVLTRANFETDLKRQYGRMTELGISANAAANLALKIATGAAKPVDLGECLALCKSDPDDDGSLLSERMQATFSNANTLYISFLLHCGTVPSGDNSVPDSSADDDGQAAESPEAGCLDTRSVSNTLQTIFTFLETHHPDLYQPCLEAVQNLLTGQLGSSLRWHNRTAQAAVLVTLLHLPQLQQVEALDDMVAPLLATVEQSWQACSTQLQAAFQRFSNDSMQRTVFLLQQFMTIRLYRQRALDSLISVASKLMDLLFKANATLEEPISDSAFYNDVLNSPDFNLEEDWKRWRSTHTKAAFSFCRFPCMYGPAAKAKILMFDNVDIQMGEIANMLLQVPAVGVRPYLVLQVRRGPELIHDALTQIRAAMKSGVLKKPLKVKFVGEQGVDEGGVAKEFFQLVVQECFCPNYGIFSYNSDTRLHWFRPSELTDLESELELIGIIIGLAIYNSHILEFTFPHAMYKKLLDRPLGLADLESVHPEICSSLRRLLAYPAAQVEQDMALTFQVEHEVDFCNKSHDLIPDGSQVPVTGDNRGDFVRRYVDFLLNTSIQAQFDPFKVGFERLCSGPVMPMFQPAELELVICGSQDLDFEDLQRAAQYDGGFTKESPEIGWFWNVVHGFDEAQKKKLLLFVTSSERVPINGLSALSPPFCISKNGPHSDRLPTAHTCFNILLLPQYNSKEHLQDRLEVALENAQGFGLM